MLRSASGIAFRPGAIEATPWHRYSVPPEPSMLRSASGIAFRFSGIAFRFSGIAFLPPLGDWLLARVSER